MPDYRLDAPSVDLFTADELLVLCEWFGVGLSRRRDFSALYGASRRDVLARPHYRIGVLLSRSI